jgi:hypothetical protein
MEDNRRLKAIERLREPVCAEKRKDDFGFADNGPSDRGIV